MGKKLRVRDKFLLGLALSADYVLPAMLRAARGLPPQKLYSWGGPGRKRQTFYNDAWRLLKTGEIEKIIHKGKPILRLTSKGKKSLKRDFSLWTMQKKKWDEKWRIVIFDFPEKLRSKRNTLREKLINLGFGKLQRSVYISPHDYSQDLVQFLSARKLLGMAYVLTAKHEFMGDAQSLANRVWYLDELNEEYEKLYYQLEELMEKKRISLSKIKKIKEKFLNLLAEDPFLPKELFPPVWYAFEIKKLLVKLP